MPWCENFDSFVALGKITLGNFYLLIARIRVNEVLMREIHMAYLARSCCYACLLRLSILGCLAEQLLVQNSSAHLIHILTYNTVI